VLSRPISDERYQSTGVVRNEVAPPEPEVFISWSAAPIVTESARMISG
jgi:hypothetical protein